MTDLALAYLACTLAVALYLHSCRGWSWIAAGVAAASWPALAAVALWVVFAWAILVGLLWYQEPWGPEK